MKKSLTIIALLTYYMLLLIFAFWLLFDFWSSKFDFLQFLGVSGDALEEPILRTIGFTIVGGFFGGVLYNIRILHHYYVKKDFNFRWLGKYVTGPWESAGLAMVVLALIRGGVALFGGALGTEVDPVSNFASFSVGAHVGFATRDVIGWINNLAQRFFTIKEPEPQQPGTDEQNTGNSDTDKSKQNEKSDKST